MCALDDTNVLKLLLLWGDMCMNLHICTSMIKHVFGFATVIIINFDECCKTIRDLWRLEATGTCIYTNKSLKYIFCKSIVWEHLPW